MQTQNVFKNMETMFTARLLAEEGLFDFGKKHKVLSGILKDEIAELRKSSEGSLQLRELEACKKILDAFPKEIIEVRNALAHQVAELTETGYKRLRTKTKEAKEILITHEQCVEMRNAVRKHRANLQKLHQLLQ